MPACQPPRCLITDPCNIINQSSQPKAWQTAHILSSERRHGESASSLSGVSRCHGKSTGRLAQRGRD